MWGFDIDGAAVYTGDDMHRSISVGKYVNPIQNLTWVWIRNIRSCLMNRAYTWKAP